MTRVGVGLLLVALASSVGAQGSEWVDVESRGWKAVARP